MKTYQIKITKQARRHLLGIRDYIAKELLAPETARDMIALLKEKISSLSEMPDRIKLTEEEPWRSDGIHQMRVKNYYIYFWIDEEHRVVQITAVIYVMRDQFAQLEKMELE